MRYCGLGRVSLAFALTGLLVWQSGCDQFKSDAQKANDRVAEAARTAKEKKTPTAQGINAAIAELQKAVSEAAASDTKKIQARALLAQTESEAGQRLIHELNRIEPEITRALWDISQLSGQIASLNAAGQAMMGANPQTAIDAVAAKLQEMQSAGTAAGEKLKALQGQIAQIEEQIKRLTEEKNKIQAQADGDFAKARGMQEKEAAPIFVQAIEGKRKADNLGHQIVKLSESLIPLQRDLAMQQAAQKNAQEAVAALEQRRQTFEGNWSVVQEQMGKQRALAGELGQQLTKRAEELDALTKQASAVRTSAVDQLTKSADHFADASKVAAQLGQTLRTLKSSHAEAPERKAWDSLMALYDLNTFKLLEGQVRNTVGNVHASHAKLAGARKQLATEVAPVLQTAGLTAPPALAGTVDQDLAAATKAADDAYKAASALLDNVANAGQPSARPAGQVGQLFAMYGQYLTSGKPQDLTLAKDHYAKVKDDPTVAIPDGMRQTLSK